MLVVGLIVVASGCGSSKHAAAPTTATTGATTAPAAPATTNQAPGGLQGEAASAATGDIPDNQVFVTFSNARAAYSMRYPEGWAQSGSGGRVTFRDKNNIVRIVVQRGGPATIASVRADMTALHAASPSMRAGRPSTLRISGAPAVKVVYTTQSAPNPVTNKRVILIVDRYYLSHGGRRAIVDLGTPVGVDNIDAYRLMIQSFRWR
jgi:hypothetical protein